MTIIKGSSGNQLKATIENAESSNDYNNLIWTCEGANGKDVARVMGNGQKVTIYPVSVGEATVMAKLPDSSSVAKCTVIVEAGKSLVFETNSRKIQPFHSKILKYTVSPADAILTWTMSQGVDEDYFEYRDLGCDAEGNGQVEISGIKEGSGTLACVTDGGAKAQCAVRVAWDYEFSVAGTTTFTVVPTETRELEFKVSPADSKISVDSTSSAYFDYEIKNNGDGSGSVVIKPLTETSGNISIDITAQNPNKDYEEVGKKRITAAFRYDKLTPVVSFIGSDGKFSRLDDSSGALYVGDGENITMNFRIAEDRANGSIKSVSFQNTDKTTAYTCALVGTTDDSGNLIFKSNVADQIEKGYWVTEAYRPTYNGTQILNWKTTLQWWLDRYENHSTDHRSSLGLFSTDYSTLVKYHPKGPTTSDMQSLCSTNKILYLWAGGQNGREDHWSSTNASQRDVPVKSSSFGKVKDSSLNGFYPNQEFWSIAYWWCPGDQRSSTTDRSDGDFWYQVKYNKAIWDSVGHADYHMSIDPHVMTENVSCYAGNSTDQTVKVQKMIGWLNIEIYHNASIETARRPVYLEVRNCQKNLSRQ